MGGTKENNNKRQERTRGGGTLAKGHFECFCFLVLANRRRRWASCSPLLDLQFGKQGCEPLRFPLTICRLDERSERQRRGLEKGRKWQKAAKMHNWVFQSADSCSDFIGLIIKESFFMCCAIVADSIKTFCSPLPLTLNRFEGTGCKRQHYLTLISQFVTYRHCSARFLPVPDSLCFRQQRRKARWPTTKK